nr:IceA2 protein [Helicobacter pylori]
MGILLLLLLQTVKRTYGSNAVNVQVSGGVVAVTTSKGKVEEYKNGSYKRIY